MPRQGYNAERRHRTAPHGSRHAASRAQDYHPYAGDNPRGHSYRMLALPDIRIATEDRHPELNAGRKQAVDQVFYHGKRSSACMPERPRRWLSWTTVRRLPATRSTRSYPICEVANAEYEELWSISLDLEPAPICNDMGVSQGERRRSILPCGPSNRVTPVTGRVKQRAQNRHS